jgi:hypothetical protein
LAKLWASFKQGSTNDGARNPLTATYTLGKDDTIKKVVSAAEKAGFVSGELTATLTAEETETKAEEPEEKPIEKKSQKSRVGAMFDLLTFGDI